MTCCVISLQGFVTDSTPRPDTTLCGEGGGRGKRGGDGEDKEEWEAKEGATGGIKSNLIPLLFKLLDNG